MDDSRTSGNEDPVANRRGEGPGLESKDRDRQAEVQEGALEEARSGGEFTVIELRMDKPDAPEGLKRMGPQVAAFDFGERGPLPKLTVRRDGGEEIGEWRGDAWKYILNCLKER
jgi:hypothetical protein